MGICKVKHLLLIPFLITFVGAVWGCWYIWTLPSNVANDSHQLKAAMFISLGIIPLPLIVVYVYLGYSGKDKSIVRLLDLEGIRID